MGFKIRFDAANAVTQLRRYPAELSREVRLALEQHGDWAGRKFQRESFGVRTAPWERNPSSNRLRSRTGALRRSYASKTRGRGLALSLIASVGSAQTAKYARLQEEGGTITPKRGKYLTVPLRENYTAAGRVRFQSAAALKNDPSVETFLFRSGKGNLIIARRLKRKRNGSNIQPLWVLVKSVKVKPRLGFRKSFATPESIRDREARIKGALARAAAAARSRA